MYSGVPVIFFVLFFRILAQSTASHIGYRYTDHLSAFLSIYSFPIYFPGMTRQKKKQIQIYPPTFLNDTCTYDGVLHWRRWRSGVFCPSERGVPALHFTSTLAYIISPLGVEEEERVRGGKVRLERKWVWNRKRERERGQEDTWRERKDERGKGITVRKERERERRREHL